MTPERKTITADDCKTFTLSMPMFRGICKYDASAGKLLIANVEQRYDNTTEMGATFEVEWGYARRHFNSSVEAIEFYNGL